MTKQEVIQKAYGEHWDQVKDFVDENGWCKPNENMDFLNHTPCEHKYMHIVYGNPECWYMPSELKNLQNNNGWIKIESEEDLPRESGEYYVIRKFYGDIDRVSIYGDISEMPHTAKSWIWNYTHYQLIVKPKLPLY